MRELLSSFPFVDFTQYSAYLSIIPAVFSRNVEMYVADKVSWHVTPASLSPAAAYSGGGAHIHSNRRRVAPRRTLSSSSKSVPSCIFG